MLEHLKRVRPVTLVVLIVAIAAVTVMSARGWSPEQIGAVASALLAVMSQLHRLVGPPDGTDKAPPGAMILPFVLVLGCAVSGCLSRADRAEAAYGSEWVACLALQPKLARDAPIEQRREAWSRYDACLAEKRRRWPEGAQ